MVVLADKAVVLTVCPYHIERIIQKVLVIRADIEAHWKAFTRVDATHQANGDKWRESSEKLVRTYI